MVLRNAASKPSIVDAPKVATLRTNLLLRIFLVPTVLVAVQLYHAFTIQREHLEGALSARHAIPQQKDDSLTSRTILQLEPMKHLNISESFGACLMIKEDNDLLYEWLAYHYTMLPLRYVFVGSDLGNRQNPHDVLHRWKTANTGLQYWVVNVTDFMSRQHDTPNPSPLNKPAKTRGHFSQEHEDAHHALAHRQRSFISTCVRFMKATGLRWVTLFDSDEFLVMNRVDSTENITMRPDDETSPNDPNIIDQTAYRLRHALPELGSQTTVLDAINNLEHIGNLGSCHTVPRLLHGALENVSCADASTTAELARRRFHYNELSTLRFNQHARKGDFAKSKYGKVMLDVSRLSNETIQSTPRNIHRPYKPECGPGAVGNFAESVFYLNHYIGSWERYDSRQDSRRNRLEWELRAHLTSGNSCTQGVHEWFPMFLDLVGEERARYLLGVKGSLQVATAL